MKIHLVFSPPQNPGTLAEMSEGVMPPLGILYLASYVRERIPGLEIKITDGLVCGYAATINEILDFKPDILGVSINTPGAVSAYALIGTVKDHLPKTFIVTGGAHVTSLPGECLVNSKTDIAVIGEGEETFFRIVSSFASHDSLIAGQLPSIYGIAFIKDQTIIKTPMRPYLQPLDSIPFPARDLIDLKSYKGWYLSRKSPETSMVFSRGCAYHCTFCSNKVWNVSEPRLRFRSPENIADEMALLKEQFGIKEVFDNSDEFNNSLTNAKNICKELIKRDLGMTWKTQLRAKPLDEELVRLLSESGCWYVHLGIESGNPETLEGIKKGVTLEDVEAACKLLKKYRIRIMGLFMLFNVWEEEGRLCFEDAAKTKQTLLFAEQLYKRKLLDYFGWSITLPYPGSPLYDTALLHDLIKHHLRDHWDKWVNEEFTVMQLPGVSDKDVAKLKSRGSVLRARCMLRSGGFGLKDMFYILKKVMRVVKNEIYVRYKKP